MGLYCIDKKKKKFFIHVAGRRCSFPVPNKTREIQVVIEDEEEIKTNFGNMNAKKKTDEKSFSGVTTLVTEWTLDFMFISLCRHFKNGNLEKFNETLSAFEGMLLTALA